MVGDRIRAAQDSRQQGNRDRDMGQQAAPETWEASPMEVAWREGKIHATERPLEKSFPLVDGLKLADSLATSSPCLCPFEPHPSAEPVFQRTATASQIEVGVRIGK